MQPEIGNSLCASLALREKINMEFVEMALPIVSVKYSQKGNARHDAAGSQSPTRKGQS